MNTPDKCPKCGADKDKARSTIFNRFYQCGSLLMDSGVDQEPDCIRAERDQLAAELDKLKAENEQLQVLVERLSVAGDRACNELRLIDDPEGFTTAVSRRHAVKCWNDTRRTE